MTTEKCRSHGKSRDRTLADYVIDEHGPRTILRDFQTLQDYVAMSRPSLSKTGLLPMGALADLNAGLLHPLSIGLTRPQLRSYPNIQALFLLLRATGLAQTVRDGRGSRLHLDPPMSAKWEALNPTERWFSLLHPLVKEMDDLLFSEAALDDSGEAAQGSVLWSLFSPLFPAWRQSLLSIRRRLVAGSASTIPTWTSPPMHPKFRSAPYRSPSAIEWCSSMIWERNGASKWSLRQLLRMMPRRARMGYGSSQVMGSRRNSMIVWIGRSHSDWCRCPSRRKSSLPIERDFKMLSCQSKTLVQAGYGVGMPL